MKIRAMAAALAFMVTSGCATDAPPQPYDSLAPQASAERGGRIAREQCGGCHAVGPAGDSAMAAAPRFRDMGVAYPVSDLQEAMAEGLVTAHPAMPAFTFEPDQIADLIAYMESVSAKTTDTP